VRASLNTIAGWTEIARQENTDDAMRGRAVDTILRHVRQASRRLDDAMDLWRIELGELAVRPVPVHVPAIVRAAMAQVDGDARQLRATWRLTFDSEERYALADRQRLQQALSALLAHAAMHAPPGGAINIRIEMRDSQLAITIDDGGPPMSTEVAVLVFGEDHEPEAAFTPGRRFDAGLILARELLAIQHGSLLPAADRSSRLEVRLAGLAEVPATAWEPDDEFLPSRVQLRGIRVLVVDDESDAREALEGILRFHGAVVHSAASVVQALHVIDREALDVLLADIAMPGRDGYDLIRTIRKKKNLLPAAAVTAFTGDEDRARALEAGFQVHLGKPMQPERLLATVLRLANRDQ
jgi:CheY-like chemotaxis protein/anti-sigma regulatory factor (Ser/Thr protein kinase)